MIPPESFVLKGTGISIPARGLGTFQPDPKQYPNGSVKASILEAIKVGYRHIDTAFGYGTEKEVGEAIAESGILREELFVVSKLHQCFHAPEDVEVGLDLSLQSLGLEYVDLYLIHYPFAYEFSGGYITKRHPDKKPVIDIAASRAYDKTWTAMEALVEKGKTKLIGVSNFSSPKLRKILETCKIPPAVNQVELHTYFPQKGLVDFCLANGIHVTAHCPLGGAPIPALTGRKGPGPLDDATILQLAKKYQKSPAQIILNHTLSRGISIIPKTNNPQRMKENFDVMFEMEDEDLKTLDNLKGVRGEFGERNLVVKEYVGFDAYSEEQDLP